MYYSHIYHCQRIKATSCKIAMSLREFQVSEGQMTIGNRINQRKFLLTCNDTNSSDHNKNTMLKASDNSLML
jgi:hypothetical protein